MRPAAHKRRRARPVRHGAARASPGPRRAAPAPSCSSRARFRRLPRSNRPDRAPVRARAADRLSGSQWPERLGDLVGRVDVAIPARCSPSSGGEHDRRGCMGAAAGAFDLIAGRRHARHRQRPAAGAAADAPCDAAEGAADWRDVRRGDAARAAACNAGSRRGCRRRRSSCSSAHRAIRVRRPAHASRVRQRRGRRRSRARLLSFLRPARRGPAPHGATTSSRPARALSARPRATPPAAHSPRPAVASAPLKRSKSSTSPPGLLETSDPALTLSRGKSC